MYTRCSLHELIRHIYNLAKINRFSFSEFFRMNKCVGAAERHGFANQRHSKSFSPLTGQNFKNTNATLRPSNQSSLIKCFLFLKFWIFNHPPRRIVSLHKTFQQLCPESTKFNKIMPIRLKKLILRPSAGSTHNSHYTNQSVRTILN